MPPTSSSSRRTSSSRRSGGEGGGKDGWQRRNKQHPTKKGGKRGAGGKKGDGSGSGQEDDDDDEDRRRCLVDALRRVDPILSFLTKATGLAAVPLPTLRGALPADFLLAQHAAAVTAEHLRRLADAGVLSLYRGGEGGGGGDAAGSNAGGSTTAVPSWDDANWRVGFPPPPSDAAGGAGNAAGSASASASAPPVSLHGSTKAAAKRRLAALKRFLLEEKKNGGRKDEEEENPDEEEKEQAGAARTDQAGAKRPPPPSTCGVGVGVGVGSKRDGDVEGGEASASAAAEQQGGDGGEDIIRQRRNSYGGGDDRNDVVNNKDSDDAAAPKSEEELEARRAFSDLFGFEERRKAEAASSRRDDGDKNNTQAAVSPDGGRDDCGDERSDPARFCGSESAAAAAAAAALPSMILPGQLSHAGSFPAQQSRHAELSPEALGSIPAPVKAAFGIGEGGCCCFGNKRRLYRHQVAAIEAAINRRHCTVCTGTGSGKSLCFLLPVLSRAYSDDRTAIIMFPTKALAQDQLSKLKDMLSAPSNSGSDLAERIRPAALDGDTPHSTRGLVSTTANVVFTNPDTLHAAVLPSWRRTYGSFLSRLAYVVVDEAHVYEGTFGAHVAMILSRLVRVAAAAAHREGSNGGTLSPPTFISASATLPFPESHFRNLFPVAADTPVAVVGCEEDGSPRSAKHYFCWNPPVLHMDGTPTGKVTFPRPKKTAGRAAAAPAEAGDFCGRKGFTKRRGGRKRRREEDIFHPASGSSPLNPPNDFSAVSPDSVEQQERQSVNGEHFRRRHSADETALLLARAVANGVRCIAFCKTRNLVEWVFERTIAALRRDPLTAHLASKVESYRGGYNMFERRKIEQLLFRNELLGVVGTNALELGVDIGGVDLTLHCGYPSSYASLLQQAGRAGRGIGRLGVPSCAVVICFNSPSEQHLWRHPTSLLGKGAEAANSISKTGALVQSHLVCASAEFPLTGEFPVSHILDPTQGNTILDDHSLFGGRAMYEEALEDLLSNGSITEETVAVSFRGQDSSVLVFKAHPCMQKAWARVSIRSIEPVNYSLVNIAHAGQAGRTDRIHDDRAVMDTLPYSRVFYDAHPGAIVTNRGKRFKILSMTRPPAFIPDNFSYRRNLCLAAFAQPTNERYITRPLSHLFITIVKQMERVEIAEIESRPASTDQAESGQRKDKTAPGDSQASSFVTFAGCGAVSVKRTVHGYKKLSLISRAELSRSELTLPPIEFDTFGIWFDTEPDLLVPQIGEEKYGPGVHALSHAILAVAPVLAPGIIRSDIDCDHCYFAPRRIMLFDERAGGSGACERLWKLFFRSNNNILEAAIQLLEECSSCSGDVGYDGACPACINASNCAKFNMHLSRSAAVVIGKRMLDRLKRSELYQQQQNKMTADESAGGRQQAGVTAGSEVLTPRREARAKALRNAKHMHAASERQFVVGRFSWPLDEN